MVPRDIRQLVRNFYRNVSSPIRIVNSALQRKLRNAGAETVRLLINSTLGVGGLRDCAEQCFGITAVYEDFGRTLGHWGLGYGFYIVWPFVGPSSARDTLGGVGDAFL